MEILAIIPARGGSKGIPGKNIKSFSGHPLITWTISASLASAKISRTIVSTDNKDIKDIALQYGAEVPFLRPPELATDEAQTEPVLLHVLQKLQESENYIPDAVVLLQPTSPIRFIGSIDSLIETFEKGEYDAVLSVYEGHHFKWKTGETVQALYDYKNRPLRQEIGKENRIYSETGSMYITRTEILQNTQNRLGGKIGLYEISALENIDIDTLDDFTLTEIIASRWGNRLTTPV